MKEAARPTHPVRRGLRRRDPVHTSIASQIGVLELTYAAKVMNTKGFSALLCFGTVLLLYFAICFPTKMLGEKLERRLNRGSSHAT